MMRYILSLHLIFMVAWFAGLFYLPRLYVYHSQSNDLISIERFKIMERKLYYLIMTPGGLLTTIFGIWLLSLNWSIYSLQLWLHYKLLLVALLWIYHVHCGYLLQCFKRNLKQYSTRFYRIYNEIPSLLLILIIFLAVVKPQSFENLLS